MQEVQIHRSLSPGTGSGIVRRHRFNSVRKKGALQTAHPAFQVSRNDFLKENICQLPVRHQEDLPIELDEELTIRHIYDVMSNYLQLLGRKIEYQLTGHFRRDICAIYSEFITYLQKGTYADLNLACEIDGSYYLELYLYHYPDAFRNEFVFLPINKVELMLESMRSLFLDFVGYYYKSQGVSVPEENNFFNWVLTEKAEEEREIANSSECELDNEERENCKVFADCAANYQLDGRYYPYFDHIINYSYNKVDLMLHLSKARQLYSGDNLKLIECMIKGVEICSKDCITRYNYIEGNDDSILLDIYQDEIEPVDMSDLFVIVWDENDVVVEESMEYLNEMINEGGCSGVCQYLMLTTETNSVFQENSFPIELSMWFCEMKEILENYGTDK